MVSFQRSRLTCGRTDRAATALEQAEKKVWMCPGVYTHTNGLMHVYAYLARAVRTFKGTQGGQGSGKMKSEETDAKQHTYQWQKTQTTPTCPTL